MKNLAKPLLAIACLGILAYLNYSMFRAHYHGERIFPWDFTGGYHFQSFAWYSQGSLLDPPVWFPWGSIGFPSALAVQAGGWYLPLALLAALDIPYTMQVATLVQVIHVLAGAIGCYALLRRLGLGPAVALIGAAGFHFSAAFYTNQQHVDIVRGYALFPWLLWCLHPATLKRSVLMPSLGALVLYLFLVSAYPGNIVAAVYACAAYFGLLLLAEPGARQRCEYVLATVIAVAAGAALSLLKWLPFLALGPLLDPGTRGWSAVSPFGPDYFLTLALPYERDWFSADLTMRSLYLPPALWMGLFFIRRGGTLAKLGAAFTVLAIVCGCVLTTLDPTDRHLPGLNLSRFPLSDWRMVLHVGLVMLGCAGWQALADGRLGPRRALMRALAAAGLAVAAGLYALHAGYAPDDLWRAGRYMAAALAAAMILAWAASPPSSGMANAKRTWRGPSRMADGTMRTGGGRPRLLASAAAALLLLPIVVSDGKTHHRSQNAAWSHEWTDDYEVHFFGAPIRELHARLDDGPPARRPERFVVGDSPEELREHHTHPSYNRCWYSHSYCLLGYNNLWHSRPHNTIWNGLLDPATGPALLAYLRKPSQLLITARPDLPVDLAAFPDTAAPWAADVAGVAVEPLRYAADTVQYRISTPVAVRVVENELWWQGWSYRACSAGGCMPAADAGRTPLYLRTWTLPHGEWTVTLTYTQPGGKAARIAAGLGMLLLAGHAAWALRTRRRRHHSNFL